MESVCSCRTVRLVLAVCWAAAGGYAYDTPSTGYGAQMVRCKDGGMPEKGGDGRVIACLPTPSADRAQCGAGRTCTFNGFNYVCCAERRPAAYGADSHGGGGGSGYAPGPPAASSAYGSGGAAAVCPNGAQPAAGPGGGPKRCLPTGADYTMRCPAGHVCWFTGVDYVCCAAPQPPPEYAAGATSAPQGYERAASTPLPAYVHHSVYEAKPEQAYAAPPSNGYGAAPPPPPAPYGQSAYAPKQPSAAGGAFMRFSFQPMKRSRSFAGHPPQSAYDTSFGSKKNLSLTGAYPQRAGYNRPTAVAAGGYGPRTTAAPAPSAYGVGATQAALPVYGGGTPPPYGVQSTSGSGYGGAANSYGATPATYGSGERGGGYGGAATTDGYSTSTEYATEAATTDYGTISSKSAGYGSVKRQGGYQTGYQVEHGRQAKAGAPATPVPAVTQEPLNARLGAIVNAIQDGYPFSHTFYYPAGDRESAAGEGDGAPVARTTHRPTLQLVRRAGANERNVFDARTQYNTAYTRWQMRRRAVWRRR